MVQEAKNGEGHPKTRREPHRQAGAADEAQDEHNRHGHGERDPYDLIDDLCHVIPRTHFFVVAAPLLGNLDVLAVGSDLVPVHADFNAQAAVPQAHALLLPSEGMVGAGGAFVAFGLHKLEVAQVALHRVAQELFGNQARRGLIQIGAWGRFRDFVLEADHFAQIGWRVAMRNTFDAAGLYAFVISRLGDAPPTRASKPSLPRRERRSS